MAETRQADGVPETMESARRWNGYVCPSCRFVFRIPRDHDGKGVVCQNCRRLLRIPAPGDKPAPLIVPLRTLPAEKPGAGKRRKKKSGKSGNQSWDRSPVRSHHSKRAEKRQMLWMLVGGATLLTLIIGGVIWSMNGENQPPPLAAKPTALESAKFGNPESGSPAVTQISDAAILAETIPIAKKFLEATRVEDLLPLVCNPKVAEPRIRSRHPDGKIDPPGMIFRSNQPEVIHTGNFVGIPVRTRNKGGIILEFLKTPDGLKIDWECFAGWSELSWESFFSTKPTDAKVFRVNVSAVDYFNYEFADEKKWQSYCLTSPDGEYSAYGYVATDSALNARLRTEVRSGATAALMLSLKFPKPSTAKNQVIIEKLVATGWITDAETPP